MQHEHKSKRAVLGKGKGGRIPQEGSEERWKGESLANRSGEVQKSSSDHSHVVNDGTRQQR